MCLSWRLLPVLRLVLRMVESLGTSRDSVRERCLDFLQALISSDLDSDLDYVQGSLMVLGDDSSRRNSRHAAAQALQKREHTRLTLLRIVSALGKVACAQENTSADSTANETLADSPVVG